MLQAGVIVEQVVSAGAVVAFLAYYLTVVRFRAARRSLMSWYLIINNLVMAQVLTLALITSYAGRDWPARDVVRVIVYGEMAAGLVAQLALFVDSLRRRPRTERTGR